MIILLVTLFLCGIGLAVYGLIPSGRSASRREKAKQAARPGQSLKPVQEFSLAKPQQDQDQPEAAGPDQRKELEAALKRADELKAELAKKEEWLARAEAASAKFKAQFEELEGKSAKKEKELQEEFSKNVDLTRQIRESTLNYETLEGKSKELDEENQRLKHQVEQLGKELKEQLDTVAEFKKQQAVSEWVPKQEFAKLNEEYSEVERQLDVQEHKVRSLLEELTRLKAQSEEKKQQNEPEKSEQPESKPEQNEPEQSEPEKNAPDESEQQKNEPEQNEPEKSV